MIKAIEELQSTHKEVGEILKYLADVEDGEDADYTEVVMDYKWLANALRHRQTTLKLREGK